MLVGLVCASWGCSSFDGGTDVLASAPLRTAEQSGAPGMDWSCLDDAPALADPVVLAQGQARVIYSFQMVDIATRQVPRGSRARPCVLTDVQCAQPAGPWVEIDEQGWFDLTLFQGFVGYIEIVGDGSVPTLLYLSDPLNDSTAVGYPVLSVSTDSLLALASVIGVALDPTQGLITVRAYDCQGITAPGVMLAKAGAGTPWYFVDGLPTVAAAKTTEEGMGGFANVPPGVAAVDVLTPAGVPIAGQHSFVVRPGQFSSAFIGPRGVRVRSSLPAP